MSDPRSMEPSDCICSPGFTGPDCEGCVEGWYKDVKGPSECLTCPNGSFCPYASSTPTRCPENQTSPTQSTNLQDCVCNIGFAGRGNNNCTQCDPGTYQNQTNQPKCMECPSNFFCPRGSDQPSICPPIPNSGSLPGSSEERECTCYAGFSGPKCDPVVPVAVIAAAAVGGVTFAVGSGALYYSVVASKAIAGGASAAAGAFTPVVPPPTGVLHSQLSSAQVREDLIIKTHQA